jgi:hypothetical protein
MNKFNIIISVGTYFSTFCGLKYTINLETPIKDILGKEDFSKNDEDQKILEEETENLNYLKEVVHDEIENKFEKKNQDYIKNMEIKKDIYEHDDIETDDEEENNEDEEMEDEKEEEEEEEEEEKEEEKEEVIEEEKKFEKIFCTKTHEGIISCIIKLGEEVATGGSDECINFFNVKNLKQVNKIIKPRMEYYHYTMVEYQL